MLKSFRIDYAENKRYNPTESSIVVDIEPENEIGLDAKTALGVFIRTVGNLKKFNIICIQELDGSGNPVGEPIVPDEGTAILPSAIKTQAE